MGFLNLCIYSIHYFFDGFASSGGLMKISIIPANIKNAPIIIARKRGLATYIPSIKYKIPNIFPESLFLLLLDLFLKTMP